MMVPRSTRSKDVLVAAAVAAVPCFRGVARYAWGRNWNLVSDMMYTGAFPRGWKGDGIIAIGGYQAELPRAILAANVPCIGLALTDEAMPFPCVKGDHEKAGGLAADHLFERAYRSFAWAPFVNDELNREQQRGFETRLAEYGCSCALLPSAHRRIGGFWHDDWESYRRALRAKIQQFVRPTAIFAANASVAAVIIEVCRELEIPIPARVAVLSMGSDLGRSDTGSLELSSVDLDVEALAFQAAGVLDDMMAGKKVPELTVVTPTRVITRVTTDTCAVANPQIAKALACIAERFSEATLSVGDVADAAGVSRRQLERSFRGATGCTVHDYLMKRRMQEASRLLRCHSRAKVSDIAGLVGLGGSGSFFRTFRRFFGVSPAHHRADSGLAPAVPGGAATVPIMVQHDGPYSDEAAGPHGPFVAAVRSPVRSSSTIVAETEALKVS